MHVYVSHSYITHTLYQCDRLQLSVLTSSSSRQSSLGYWTPYILLVTWACPAVRWLLDFGVLTLGWYIRNLGLNLVQIQHNQFSNTQYQRMIMWSYTWHLAWYMCMCDECMRSFTLDVPDDLPPHPKGFRRSKIQVLSGTQRGMQRTHCSFLKGTSVRLIQHDVSECSLYITKLNEVWQCISNIKRIIIVFHILHMLYHCVI